MSSLDAALDRLIEAETTLAQLRAENERLRADYALTRTHEVMAQKELIRVNAENERLRAELAWPPEIPVSEADRERQELEFEAAQAERLRVNRWWRTYNAALPLFGAMPYVEDRHRACVTTADRAHGPLTPESET